MESHGCKLIAASMDKLLQEEAEEASDDGEAIQDETGVLRDNLIAEGKRKTARNVSMLEKEASLKHDVEDLKQQSQADQPVEDDEEPEETVADPSQLWRSCNYAWPQLIPPLPKKQPGVPYKGPRVRSPGHRKIVGHPAAHAQGHQRGPCRRRLLADSSRSWRRRQCPTARLAKAQSALVPGRQGRLASWQAYVQMVAARVNKTIPVAETVEEFVPSCVLDEKGDRRYQILVFRRHVLGDIELGLVECVWWLSARSKKKAAKPGGKLSASAVPAGLCAGVQVRLRITAVHRLPQCGQGLTHGALPATVNELQDQRKQIWACGRSVADRYLAAERSRGHGFLTWRMEAAKPPSLQSTASTSSIQISRASSTSRRTWAS